MGWSDEYFIEKAADPRQVYVFRRPGEHEKFLPKNFLPKDKSGSVSLMVWGCFASSHLGPLVSFRSINTVATYIIVVIDIWYMLWYVRVPAYDCFSLPF